MTDDGGKKVSGRKRHLLVDTGGLVLKALVYAANVTDRVGGQQLLEAMGDLAQTFPRLRHLWVDSAYQGSFKDWVEQTLHWTVEVVKRPSRWVWVPADQEPPPAPTGFQVLHRRWVVERTLGWLGRWRRTSKDYEYLPATSECVIYLTMIRVMLRRLAET
jgi:putative transposase